MPNDLRCALITGANRGLGFETACQLHDRGWNVWIGARSAGAALAAAEKIGPGAFPLHLDVLDAALVSAAVETILHEGGGMHALVNNAGIDYDSEQYPSTADLERVRQIFETNLFGAWRITQAMVPLLKSQAHSTIVNVSSGAGATSEANTYAPGYSLSKMALNALTRQFAAELKPYGVLVNAVCPGRVATRMSAKGRPVPEGARGVVWAATLPPGGPTGGFFREEARIPW